MNNKHHTREGYEQLLIWLWKQRGRNDDYDFIMYSDYNLLRLINNELIFFNCEELTIKELGRKLY